MDTAAGDFKETGTAYSFGRPDLKTTFTMISSCICFVFCFFLFSSLPCLAPSSELLISLASSEPTLMNADFLRVRNVNHCVKLRFNHIIVVE